MKASKKEVDAMRTISAQQLTDAVAKLCVEANLRLPEDVRIALEKAHAPDPYYAALEEALLEQINATGIGPQGFGGKTTCLGVAIEAMPTHVAGLPVAVNISCHATRRATLEV